MSGYRAILFSPDGEDFVTDFSRDTKQEVWDELANMGSRWIFYPIVAIITDKPTGHTRQRIVDGCVTEGEDFHIDTSEYIGESVTAIMRDIRELIGARPETSDGRDDD